MNCLQRDYNAHHNRGGARGVSLENLRVIAILGRHHQI
jgi:hypothetical protein